MIVTIPRIVQHCGYPGNLVTIEISDQCPKCGLKRGVRRYKGSSYDGSLRLEVDCWENQCDHVDKYTDVIKEYEQSITSSLS